MLGRRRGDIDAPNQGDHPEVLESGVVETVVRLHALGRGIVGSIGVESLGDPGAERAGDDRAGDGRDHDRAAATSGQVGERVQHQAVLLWSRVSASSAA